MSSASRASRRTDRPTTAAGPGGAADHPLSSAELEPATYVLDAMARMHHAVFQIGTDRLRPWGITLSSYAALRVLDRRPDLTLAQLSRRCFVRPQTMTRMVTQLEKRGLIERQPRPSGGRTLSLRLTGEGLAVLRQMGGRVNKINATITGVLAPHEIEQLNSMLRRCAIEVEREIDAEAGRGQARRAPGKTA